LTWRIIGIYNTCVNQTVKVVLDRFDAFLQRRGFVYETTVIGGAALIVMGITNRRTKDVDCLTPSIPLEIARAAKDFANSEVDLGLDQNWFNNEPASLANDLPAGWQGRRVPLYRGKALVLITLGRMDILRAKIFAYLDRQKDLDDCIALKPLPGEVMECYPWLKERDANPDWPEYVRKSLILMGKRLGYELKLG